MSVHIKQLRAQREKVKALDAEFLTAVGACDAAEKTYNTAKEKCRMLRGDVIIARNTLAEMGREFALDETEGEGDFTPPMTFETPDGLIDPCGAIRHLSQAFV